MSKKYFIKAENVKLNITPLGFFKYASDYFDTANKWTVDTKFSPVPYFLYCRTIELALKSYLLAKGTELKWIKKKLSHDLNKALEHAIKNCLEQVLVVTDDDKKEIAKANEYYKSKGFEYFLVSNHVKGLALLPDLEKLKNFACKLLVGIKLLAENTEVE
jgi:hypothetical protein